MIPPPKSPKARNRPAFSLIEMLAVAAIFAILMAAGVSLLHGTGAQSRKATSDLMINLIEQARTKAITSRSHVVLAIAEPADFPTSDGRFQVGLFRVDQWPDPATVPLTLKGEILNRWQSLDTGIILIGGEVNGVANPLDQEKGTISYGDAKSRSIRVHLIAVNSRGGLDWPLDANPIALRIVEGRYQYGMAIEYRQGGQKRIAESRLKIGRISARPYPMD